MRPRHTYRFGRDTARRALFAIGLGALSCAAPASAQTATGDTESATAEANIVRPLTFFKIKDLEFGRIISSGAAGTVRIHVNGTRTSTGGVTLIGSSSEYHPAEFAGQGGLLRVVFLSTPSGTVWLTGPGQRMRVRNFEVGSTPTAILNAGNTRFSITGPSGVFEFPLGGILDVNANQAAGAYTGTFTVTANYL